MHEDKYHLKNMGIVYPNTHVSFSGIVYLNKTFEEDTGTTVYKLRKGWSSKHTESKQITTKHWLGEIVSDDDYNEAYKHQMDQYEETITIKSIYNRLVIFSSDTYHTTQTYGSMGERLSMYFYGQQKLSSQHPPLFR